MIFYAFVVAAGFAGGYFFAAGYGGKAASSIGSALKTAELDALGLLDDNPTDTNQASAGSP